MPERSPRAQRERWRTADLGTQGVGDVDVGNLGSYAEQGRAGILTVKMCLVDLVRKRN